jgi:hypothetical protein
MALLTDNRLVPLAAAYLYEPGQGDPVVTRRRFGFYDVPLEHQGRGAVFTGNATLGITDLEILPDVGLVCRPYVNLVDTQAVHYALSPSTAWEERKPSTGTPRVKRLVMFDTTAGTVYSATSKFNLPKNPSIAFSMIFVDSPPDWDAVAFPPFIRFEFGTSNARFAIQFSKTTGASLVRWVVNQWLVVADLPEPSSPGYADVDEKLIILRCLRGKLLISTDFGREYTVYENPKGAAVDPISVPAAEFILRGQGGQVVFGLQQLVYNPGSYDCPTRNTFDTDAYLSAVPTLIPRKFDGTNGGANATAVTLTDVSVPAGAQARYRAALAPHATLMGNGVNHYHTPELYTVAFEYPALATIPSLVWSKPWQEGDGSEVGIEEVQITKPFAVSESYATIRFRVRAGEDWNWRWGRYPKVTVYLGDLSTTGAVTTRSTFVGYAHNPRYRMNGYNRATVEFDVWNLPTMLRRRKWTKLDRLPLGGVTLNQALDAVIGTEGLGAAYRSWHSVGDLIPLPLGSPENPFLWPAENEDKWETLETIAKYGGLEIGVTDDGILYTQRINFVSPLLKFSWAAIPAAELRALILNLQVTQETADCATCILVDGTSEGGEAMLAFWVNGRAETLPGAGDYCAWREIETETIPGTATPGLLALRAQQLGLELFPVKWESDLTCPVNLDISRRDQVAVVDGAAIGVGKVATGAGIASWDRFAILSLEHRYTHGVGIGPELTTDAGLRLLTTPPL